MEIPLKLDETMVETCSRDGSIDFFQSVEEAFDHADKNGDVWKVSFNTKDGTRCRFVRGRVILDEANVGRIGWIFDPIVIDDEVKTG